MSLDYRWEWLASTPNTTQFEWKAYNPKLTKLFNDSIIKKLSKVEFEENGNKFEAIFKGGDLVQKNLKTGYERPIRLCIKEEEEDDVEDKQDKKVNTSYFYWRWLNESNKWITYSAYTTIDLETNYRLFKKSRGKKNNFDVTIEETKTTYSFDFKKMIQVNKKTSFARKVKREMSDVTNTNEESKEEDVAATTEEKGPSSNLRKRKSLSQSDKKLSTTSTISISSSKSDDENDGADSKKNGAKKLKKSIKKENDENEDSKAATKRKLDKLKQEESENDDKEDESCGPKTSKSNGKVKRAKSVKKEPKEEKDEEEKEDEEVVTKKSKSNAKKSAPVKEEPEEIIKTVKYTGDIPLDEKFTEVVGTHYKIYKENNVPFECMLNQTNLQYNNNKYYLIQLIENCKNKEYLVWFRWGRVGKAGQFTVEHFGADLNKAKDLFCKKFLDKTKNDWDNKDNFEKYPGKYDLVEKDYEAKSTEDEDCTDAASIKQEKVERVEKPVPPSKLEKRIQDLIELICNVTEMENILKEMKFDAKKAPLGKLSKNQIKAGYAALKEIEDLIKNKKLGKELVEANNDFYTRIPHDFGMRTPPMIRTNAEIREKMKLLEILEDIEVAVKALNQKSEIDNPVDRHYDQLDCEIKLLDHNDKMFKIIQSYLTKNHGPTHNNYKMKLLDVFEVKKQEEHDRFKDVGNRMLLWHGSRLTNWAGILSQGLRIAPPEAPVTGYMFGKGCYFADCSSKSANYCYTTTGKNTGLVSLSEVSLGAWNELKNADYDADKLPKGKLSTKGLGRSEPDKNEWVTLDDGCIVPVGKLKSVANKAEANTYSLLYNEFVVYDVAQIKMRYLVKVEFDYDMDDEDED